MDDRREILSVGFVDIDAVTLETAVASVAEQEAVPHSRIEEVIESTVFRAYFGLRTEHDFTAEPREIDLASPASLLASLRETREPSPGKAVARYPR